MKNPRSMSSFGRVTRKKSGQLRNANTHGVKSDFGFDGFFSSVANKVTSASAVIGQC